MAKEKKVGGFVKEIELSSVDLEVFLRLQGNKDFQRFREIAEIYLQKNAYDLISWNYENDEKKQDALSKARGAWSLWSRITRWIDTADQINNNLENENEDKKD